MSCFTAENILEIGVSAEIRSCQIGDDIWIIQKVHETNFEIWKWDTKTTKYSKIDYKNRALVEIGGPSDFEISAKDGKIYMWKKLSYKRKLLEYQPKTMEWRSLVEVEMDCCKEFLELDGYMYIKQSKYHMIVMDLTTFQKTTVTFPHFNSTIDQSDLVEMDGLMYLITMLSTGRRVLYQYDKENEEFVKVMKNWKGKRMGDDTNVFLWSDKSKIYLAAYNNSTFLLTIDCLCGKKWRTIFEEHYPQQIVRNIHTIDGNIYVISDRTVDVVIRKIEMMPSLEKLALNMMAEEIVREKRMEEMNIVIGMVPYELRQRFKNMVHWKLQKEPKGQLEYQIEFLEKIEAGKRALDKKKETLRGKYYEIMQREEYDRGFAILLDIRPLDELSDRLEVMQIEKERGFEKLREQVGVRIMKLEQRYEAVVKRRMVYKYSGGDSDDD